MKIEQIPVGIMHILTANVKNPRSMYDKVVLGTIEYTRGVHQELVQVHGGINRIKDRIKNEPMLFGEKFYLERIVAVQDAFNKRDFGE